MFAPHAQPLLHGRHVAPLCPRTLVVLLHQLRLVAHQAQRLGAVGGVQRLVQPAEAAALQALPHLLQQAAAACSTEHRSSSMCTMSEGMWMAQHC